MKSITHFVFIFLSIFSASATGAEVSMIICGKSVYADRSTSNNSLSGEISDQYLKLLQMISNPLTEKNQIIKQEYKRLSQADHFPRVYRRGQNFAFVFLSERSASESEARFMIVEASPFIGLYWKEKNEYDAGLMPLVTECELLN